MIPRRISTRLTALVAATLFFYAQALAQHNDNTKELVGPEGPDKAKNSLRISLLGTGIPIPRFRQFSISTLVEAGNQKFLFDCGRGAALRLHQLKVPFRDVDKLFITHHHSDHVVGIPDVWLTGWIMGRRDTPFRVWGPQGTEKMMFHLQRAFEEDIIIRRDKDPKFPGEGILVDSHDITEGVVYKQGDVKVTAFLVDHGQVKPAYGFRLDWGELSVGLSGDTKPSKNLIKHCKGVDVLIHECATSKGGPPDFSKERRRQVTSKHTRPNEAGEVFSKVGPRLAVFSHMQNDEDSTKELLDGAALHFDGPVFVGQDLVQIDVSNNQIIVYKQGKLLLSVD